MTAHLGDNERQFSTFLVEQRVMKPDRIYMVAQETLAGKSFVITCFYKISFEILHIIFFF